jgi:hypothetical protein
MFQHPSGAAPPGTPPPHGFPLTQAGDPGVRLPPVWVTRMASSDSSLRHVPLRRIRLSINGTEFHR